MSVIAGDRMFVVDAGAGSAGVAAVGSCAPGRVRFVGRLEALDASEQLVGSDGTHVGIELDHSWRP